MRRLRGNVKDLLRHGGANGELDSGSCDRSETSDHDRVYLRPAQWQASLFCVSSKMVDLRLFRDPVPKYLQSHWSVMRQGIVMSCHLLPA